MPYTIEFIIPKPHERAYYPRQGCVLMSNICSKLALDSYSINFFTSPDVIKLGSD